MSFHQNKKGYAVTFIQRINKVIDLLPELRDSHIKRQYTGVIDHEILRARF
jgi:hypothetical protein